jgi:hypothetical protein
LVDVPASTQSTLPPIQVRGKAAASLVSKIDTAKKHKQEKARTGNDLTNRGRDDIGRDLVEVGS